MGPPLSSQRQQPPRRSLSSKRQLHPQRPPSSQGQEPQKRSLSSRSQLPSQRPLSSWRRRGACLLTACLLTVAVGLAGCGGGDGGASSTSGLSTTSPSSAQAPGSSASTSPSASGDAVTIKDFAFAPTDLTVAKGTTVEFTNEDGTSHTATSKDTGAFDTGTIKPGKSGEVTLDEAGTFAYYCVFHPFMKGTITVQP